MKVIVDEFRFAFGHRFITGLFHGTEEGLEPRRPHVSRTILFNTGQFAQQMSIANCVCDIFILPVWRPAVMYSNTAKLGEHAIPLHADLGSGHVWC